MAMRRGVEARPRRSAERRERRPNGRQRPAHPSAYQCYAMPPARPGRPPAGELAVQVRVVFCFALLFFPPTSRSPPKKTQTSPRARNSHLSHSIS